MKIAALLPHVEIFGGIRRYLEIGNELAKRGYYFVLFHPDGSKPGWLEFKGITKSFSSLGEEDFDIGLCSEYLVLPYFEKLNATAKAMACQIPVVCSRSGTRDFAFHNQTALVVPFPHPLFLRYQIKKLLKDEELRLRIARAGYEKMQKFSWSALADRLERILKELVKLNLGIRCDILLNGGN